MATLQLFDPEAANGLRNVAALSDKDFAAMLAMEDHPPSMGRNVRTSLFGPSFLTLMFGPSFLFCCKMCRKVCCLGPRFLPPIP